MDNIFNWVFFAAGAKPTSMRRAIAERLAERESVIIIDGAISVVREFKAFVLSASREHLPGLPDCWRYRPIHFPERLPGIGKFSRRLNERLLQRELDQLLPPGARRLVCYDSPGQAHLVGKLREDMSVYLGVDDRTLTVWGAPIPGELEAEKDLLGKVDKVICVSETLAKTLIKRIRVGRTIPIHVLPNGYDERLFDPARKYPEPPILANIPRPRILVTGHVSERIDWEGVVGAIKARPKWTWVFVGPADAGLPKKIKSLAAQIRPTSNCPRSSNPIWRDAIPVERIPGLIAHCDACAVPYRLNAFTRASSPLKAIEYLAMGVPVISTRVPSLEQYGEAIQWIEETDGESYARELDTVAAEKNHTARIEARRAAVANESWAVKINHFRKMVLNAGF